MSRFQQVGAVRPRRPWGRWLGLAGLVCLLLAGSALAGGDGRYTLTVLHTNDMHAHLDPFDGVGASCDQAKDRAGNCQGGVARLATAIARERAKGGPLLLLDAGDQFQGTLYFTKFQGAPLAVFMNRLHYDAMIVGNHEFDDGPAPLAAFLQALHFPVVAANLDVSRSPELRGLIRPLVVCDVGGRKVGIVGVAQYKTPQMSSPGPNVTFEKTIPAVAKAVAELKRQGVTIIIALSHAGLGMDKKLAAAVPDLDIIVGGHSHVLLGNGYPEAVGPCPLVVPHPVGGPTLIVTAGYWGRYLGVLHATFDAAGRVTAASGNPVRLDAKIPEDPATVAALAPYAQSLESYRKQVLGTADAPLDAATCRRAECLPGDLTASAMLAAARRQGAVAALTNGGSIRAGLPAGPINWGDVLTSSPFHNTLVVVTLPGTALRDALEYGLGRVGDTRGTGRFLQVAGLRYTFDGSKPEGSRLLSVAIADKTGAFRPLAPQASYRVAINSFLWSHGDGFDLQRQARGLVDTGRVIADVLADFIRHNSPLRPALDGRIRAVEN